MNETILNEILKEVLEEQRENTVNTGLMAKATENLSDKITGIEEKATGLKITAPEPDLEPIKELLKKHFQILRALIDAQPKEVRQVKQIMLFPIESHKLEFYKAVLGQLFKWAAILVIVLVVIFKIEHYLK
ncbi:hypothetical protein [Parafilimonas sp.]|uniref:hypothetical protein n=1 Tax=Parafilimonas sp. TaxID=1969739 RepID=UPI0039E294D0